MKPLKKLFWKIFTSIDRRLKFPNLKKGGFAIQCGFDMDSSVTSDLFLMSKKVGLKGKVYGIDPDPSNHAIAKNIISERSKNVSTIQAAIADKTSTTNLRFGEKRGWNQLTSIPLDSTVSFRDNEIEVEVKTLPQIIKENDIELQKIQHINLTINGFEYHALKGMKDQLMAVENLSLTIIAGRYDETGTIEGHSDHELILDLLQKCGFRTRFKRIHQLFWWGFIVKLMMQRNYIYNKKNYGVIFAAKGNHRMPWWWSFS